MNERPLLDPLALRRIARLDLVARQIVEGTLSGLHRSPFHGFSVEFLQHRPYVPGDDLRHLDWKILGKTDRPYVRQFEDETNLRATILLDASGSMAYGSGPVRKSDYAVRFAAALAYLLIEQGDSVGLLTFDTAVRASLPARSGRRQLAVMLDALESVEPGGETSLAGVLAALSARGAHGPRRGLVLLITDAFDDLDKLMPALARLRSAHHEVIVFQTLDRREVDFEFDHWVRFECLETDDQSFLVEPAQIRRSYLERFERAREELREGCHRHRIDLVPLMTDRPYDEALGRYLATRGEMA